ncbi:MAG: PAS domain-containing protein [Ferruginibacter sp.]
MPKNTDPALSRIKKKPIAPITECVIHRLAFDTSLQPNIITEVSSGKIIIANTATGKLLGYSKKDLLTKNRSTIFAIKESSFKKMLKQRTAEGGAKAFVTAIKKNGELITCEITSAVFIDEDGIEKAITTITDMRETILLQKHIDEKKEQLVAGNIILAKSVQKKIDIKKEKIVSDDIKRAQQKSDIRLAENNEWIKYIAKESYDVMWDWDIATGEIYVGDSLIEVFGYFLEKNTASFADFLGCLLPDEKDAVGKKLNQALSSSAKSWKDSFTFQRHDGSIASAICRASIVRDDDGKAIRLIGAIQDISKLQELEKKLEAQLFIQEEHKLLLATKLSVDVMWDWNLKTNEVIIGEGFEDLFGYTIKNSKGIITDKDNYVHPGDKEAFKKGLAEAIASSESHWENVYRFIRADGSVAVIFDRASIVRHDNGTAYRLIGAMQDISRQKELDEKLDYQIAIKTKLLKDYKESFKLIFNSSPDILYDCDLIANEVLISDAYEKEFGYKITSKMAPAEAWASHIHPDDKEAVLKDYERVLASGEFEWKYNYRFLKADNSIANIISTGIILRNTAGKAYRTIGSMHDISKQKVLEDRLDQEIHLKEKQIAEATQEAKDTERSVIGKELHDNVNQLLGASRLYLDMAKRGGENSEFYLTRSSEYTLTAIEEIRKLSKALTTDIIKDLGLSEAIEDMARDLMEVNHVKISCILDNFIENRVNDKFKLNVFRIVQEQLNNTLKHAKATKVTISFSQNKKSINLSISDDGLGFDTTKKQKGIGLQNIKSRATAYKGIAEFISKPGEGCVLVVKFPVTDIILKKN